MLGGDACELRVVRLRGRAWAVHLYLPAGSSGSGRVARVIGEKKEDDEENPHVR